jgi:hypothetical protein
LNLIGRVSPIYQTLQACYSLCWYSLTRSKNILKPCHINRTKKEFVNIVVEQNSAKYIAPILNKMKHLRLENIKKSDVVIVSFFIAGVKV